MTSAQLREILKSNVLILSQAKNCKREEVSDLVDAGAHIILAPTFPDMTEADEDKLAEIFEGVQDKAFVAGQIFSPVTPVQSDEDYKTYYGQVLAQAEWLERMEISMIFLTDFTDILTAKCALYAVKEGTNLPVCVAIKGKDDEGSVKESLSLLLTLQALDVCAFGLSDMLIDDALDLISELQAFATVPLFSICQPGLYLEPEEYGDYIPSFVSQKCAILGLSSDRPAFITTGCKALWQLSPIRPDFPVINAISSKDEIMFLDFSGKVISSNKQYLEIKTEKMEDIVEAMPLLNQSGSRPVCFSVKDLDVLEYAVSHYAGRPAVKSDEYGEITAKELGALVLAPEKKQ